MPPVFLFSPLASCHYVAYKLNQSPDFYYHVQKQVETGEGLIRLIHGRTLSPQHFSQGFTI